MYVFGGILWIMIKLYGSIVNYERFFVCTYATALIQD